MSISKTPKGESLLEEPHTAQQSSMSSVPIAPLPDPISQNIEAIVVLHTNAERDMSQHQRIVEAATTFFARPMFLYSSLLVVALWMLTNVLPQSLGLPHFDVPPFDLLQLSL